MKISFFKKFALALTCFMGVFAMASCQSTDSSKAHFAYDAEYAVFTGDDSYTAKVVIGVENPTIYNINKFTIDCEIHGKNANGDEVIRHTTREESVLIGHGAAGYFGGDVFVSKDEARTQWGMTSVNKLKITNISNIKFLGVWETYMPWWIVCFVLLGLSTIAFAATIFKKNISIENAGKLFKAHIASSLTTLCLVLLICLIPLIFSGWVVTMLLLGTFVAHFIIAFLLCAIKSKIGHHGIGYNIQNPKQ